MLQVPAEITYLYCSGSNEGEKSDGKVAHGKDIPIKNETEAGSQWFMPIILAIGEAEIRRIVV
jgi:hypothetical protein